MSFAAFWGLLRDMFIDGQTGPLFVTATGQGGSHLRGSGKPHISKKFPCRRRQSRAGKAQILEMLIGRADSMAGALI